MIDETMDARFERDLRVILRELDPGDAPASLYASVAAVPLRGRSRRAWTRGRMAFAGIAMAAVVVVAVAGIALTLRPWGDLPIIGGPTAPPPTLVPAQGQELVLTFQVQAKGNVQPGPEDIEAVVSVLRARMASSVGAAAAISTGNDGEITVSVAMDPTDEDAVTGLRQLLGTTGQLDFVPLGDEPASEGQALDLAAHPPLFSGDQVASAKIGSDQAGSRTLDFTFWPDGARLFADYTQANIGTYFAIVLDGVVISAPVINSAIPNGEVQISQGSVGGFPLGEAQALVGILEAGTLPFPIQEISNNLGPTPSDGASSPAPVPSAVMSPEPSPSVSAAGDAALVAAARDYAAAVGIAVVDGGSPVVEDARPDFDDVTLRLVTLPLADATDAGLLVYFDDAGRIAVVVDGAASNRPTGTDVSKDGALEAAARHFRVAGTDPGEGTLTVASGAPGDDWYITLGRVFEGHPVANTVMRWRFAGDRAYVTLRRDGTLVELYAIRPRSDPAPEVLAGEVLDAQLAIVSGRSARALAALHPALAWVRATDAVTGVPAPTLTLGYCATEVKPDRWTGWCVDAGTGERSVVDGGID